VVCINKEFSLPVSCLNCLIASIKGRDSISPIVPPISVITISAPDESAASLILFLISLVICGTTCTVDPEYSPFLSFSITEE